MNEIDRAIIEAENELIRLDAERNSVRRRINLLKSKKSQDDDAGRFRTVSWNDVEKIRLFRSLFRGREDVYPKRFESRKTGKSGYQPDCGNEWGPGICMKPRVRCPDCDNRKLLPVTDDIIRNHLLGRDQNGRDFTMGIYPLLEDESCFFLASDFDKKTWQPDVKAFLETCRKLNIPASLERSRSGNGAHVWIFFKEAVPAHIARQMGTYIITETMETHPELGFDSYDRFFPNQDTMPQGGFGNLIALPLQAKPRQNGNSVFLDDDLTPLVDQSDYLSKIRKMSFSEVNEIAGNAVKNGRVTGVKMIEDDSDDLPWEQPPSRRKKEKTLNVELPGKLEIVIENQIYLPKEQLPARLKIRILRIAAFQNPEFYRAQAMRLPVYSKPRIISCSEDFSNHIGLPRGCAAELAAMLISLKIKYNVTDKRNYGSPFNSGFRGQLREEQQKAVCKLIPHDIGVLSASTAFGKTVIAAYMIAERKVNTLILVHRVQLIEQWKARLENFLEIKPDEIGIIGGGKCKPQGRIDIATIQSLCKKGTVDDIVGKYGHVIVDECHHLSAFSFEIVARQCKAKYFLGLSATLARKDGHHPIIFMQCGPVRYRVNDKVQAAERPFSHRVLVRKTNLKISDELNDAKLPIHQLYAFIMNDSERNEMIIKDVVNSLCQKRSPVVITERKEHLEYLADKLKNMVKNLIVLKGGMSVKEQKMVYGKLSEIPDEEERVIIATGKYLGEGFDDARLDTLFLAMPISWKGTLSQYAGRLHRLHYMKKEVQILDYADLNIPMTAGMYKRRCSGYIAIGYEIDNKEMTQPPLISK